MMKEFLISLAMGAGLVIGVMIVAGCFAWLMQSETEAMKQGDRYWK